MSLCLVLVFILPSREEVDGAPISRHDRRMRCDTRHANLAASKITAELVVDHFALQDRSAEQAYLVVHTTHPCGANAVLNV